MKRWITSWAALLVAAAVLLGVRLCLRGYAAQREETVFQSMLCQLLPGSTAFEREAYSGEDANITAAYKSEAGYVVETVTAGYVGDIALLTGVGNNGKVTGILVRDMEETYGLGLRAASDGAFLSQFLQTNGGAAIGENVDAVTGATVTSKAIARGVNSAAAFVTGADVSSAATEWGG